MKLAVVALLAACGDNLELIAPPLEHADIVFLAAHPDDEMIFMQPEVLASLHAGSIAVVYATTANAKGVDEHLYDATMVAYGAELGKDGWECGSLSIGPQRAQHCRLHDQPISILNLGLPDGGIAGNGDSLLHLVDGTEPGGVDAVVDTFAALLAATTPGELHTLDLSATHGRDHSSHLFTASFALWASARLGLRTPMTWHRGYNVEPETPTLSETDMIVAQGMLGYYEACADGRTCGEASTQVLPEHATWLARQYAHHRVVDTTVGEWTLVFNELWKDGACLTAHMDGTTAMEPCDNSIGQYWVVDDERHVWSGLPPLAGGDMSMDHVRCLTPDGAPTCGAHLAPTW